jgi:penicillin amidase
MKRAFKFSGLLLLILLLAALASLAWYRSASQPKIEGQLAMPGLEAPVDVVRDAEGIPHIYARSTHDAWFALGVLHAQDRLWQMEMNRRIAAGRMSEVLGPDALGTDRFLRTLGVRRNAQAIERNLSPEAHAVLDAYAAGINSWREHRNGPLPPEFLLTRAPEPEPWQPADSLAWQTMMAWDLGGNWTQELLRMRLSQRFSLSQINELMPPYPGDPVLRTQDYTGLYRDLAGTTRQLTRVSAIAPPSPVEGMGSNNWVVSGARSTSGKPLLANDPHLSLSAPALWYFAHLSAPGLDVIGATLPGIPGVVLGHNKRIAWGFTNTAPDVQDLYIERINPAEPNQYQTPDGWAAFASRSETIKVKGKPDVTMTVRETRHGPVITGALPLVDRAPLDARGNVISMAWTALRPDDMTFQAGLRINQAQDWNGFLAAVRDFHSPQQNMVYADVDGNIGFVAPGRVPVRAPENDLKGLAPAPGWDRRYDWNGFIPFDELPRQFNPPLQRVVTANQKIVAPDYPHFLTSEWSLPYRADRIVNLLDATPKHDLQSFAAIQRDVVSLAAQELLPVVRGTEPRSSQARLALAALASWNGTMDMDRMEPLVFNAWMREVSRELFQEKLGEPLMKDFWDQRNVHQPMVNILKNEGGQGHWCRGTEGNGTPRTCAELLSGALEAALGKLSRSYGTDMARWRWGDAHVARSAHRPFSNVAALAPLFDIRVPVPGDTYTVNVGRYSLRDEAEPFSSRHGPSLRALYDLSNLENSVFIHSTGESGNVFSPWYRNYAQRWAEGKYLPMKTVRADVMKTTGARVLQLTP